MARKDPKHLEVGKALEAQRAVLRERLKAVLRDADEISPLPVAAEAEVPYGDRARGKAEGRYARKHPDEEVIGLSEQVRKGHAAGHQGGAE